MPNGDQVCPIRFSDVACRAGGIDEDSLTLEPCMRFVDEWVTVTEEEIARAMVGVEAHDGHTVEGGILLSAGAFSRWLLRARQWMAGCQLSTC
jgi:threonine dehydratase